MKKIIEIEGMTCEHCKAKVETLNLMDGITAKVNLKKKTATIQYEGEVNLREIEDVITGLGYKVSAIRDGKIFFWSKNESR